MGYHIVYRKIRLDTQEIKKISILSFLCAIVNLNCYSRFIVKVFISHIKTILLIFSKYDALKLPKKTICLHASKGKIVRKFFIIVTLRKKFYIALKKYCQKDE